MCEEEFRTVCKGWAGMQGCQDTRMLGHHSKMLLRALLDHLYFGPQIQRSMSLYHHAGTPPIEFHPKRSGWGPG